MNRYALIENGFVTQISVKKTTGLIEVGQNVVCGMQLIDGEFVNPKQSNEELFNREMEALNSEYDKAVTDLSIEYNIAVARDGSTETEKVTAIRGKMTALDGKYETDQLEIINKYYGA